VRRTLVATVLALFVSGCASNVRFIQTDDSFKPAPAKEGAVVEIHKRDIARPYRVVGVIEAKLGKKARRPELDALLLKKAREIGVDAVILVEYDIDRYTYVERHHAVVGRGPWRHHVVTSRPRVAVEKTATGIAVVFK